MIKVEYGNITMQGRPVSLLVELTLIIKTLKLQFEEKGVPKEEAERMLSDAYMFAVVKPEIILEVMRTYAPGEVIKWEEILN